MLSSGLAAAAVVAWSAAAATSAADLYGEGVATVRVTRALSLIGFTVTAVAALGHAAALGPANVLAGHGVFLPLSVVVGTGTLVLAQRSSMRAVPSLAGLLAAGLAAAYLIAPATGPAEPETRSLILAHVILVLTGVGAFGLAAVLSVFYLLQERQLRRKQFGRVFQKLPSLDELDVAGFRLVAWGIVAYTAALIIGFTWVEDGGAGRSPVRVGLAVLAWAIFAAVIHTRVTMGWRGSRAAAMTIIGCVSVFLVLAGYVA